MIIVVKWIMNTLFWLLFLSKHIFTILYYSLELGGIPVHTENRCIFSLWYEFYWYIWLHNIPNATLRRMTRFQTGSFSMLRFLTGMVQLRGVVRVNSIALVLCYGEDGLVCFPALLNVIRHHSYSSNAAASAKQCYWTKQQWSGNL